MSSTPLIGFACQLEKHAKVSVRDKSSLRCVYTNAILRGGGIPVVIPVSEDRSGLDALYDKLDGIVLPGSEDIPPSRYGQTPHPSVSVMPDAQYEAWAALLQIALAKPKPLLAICGGLQVLNVALGGSLIQDIPSQTDSKVAHHSRASADATHAVDVVRASRLGSIFGAERITVNSAHHQAIDRLGERLTVTAQCPDDGIIEAVDMADHPFLLAVQWHPERRFKRGTSRRLFSAFIRACRAG